MPAYLLLKKSQYYKSVSVGTWDTKTNSNGSCVLNSPRERERERERDQRREHQQRMMKRKSQVQEGHKEDQKEKKELELAVWDCGSPLYDSYELVSLSHLIERHLMILPSHCGSPRFNITRFSHPIDVGPPMKSDNVVGITTKVAKGSSMVASLSAFMERKMWKRRVFGERKDKFKKVKISNLSRLYNRIVPWKKKENFR